MFWLLKIKIPSRLRDRTSDGARGAVLFDESDVLAPMDEQSATIDLADEHDGAAKRATFSQHISC